MKYLGLDIGTTSISAVVSENGTVLESLTCPNDSFMIGAHSWERMQDPNKIRNAALASVETLLSHHTDVSAIGVTGQMHGIVYLDRFGNPVSPLYTWQDGRGDCLYDDAHTYASVLSMRTGYSLASGYGMVTHFYNIQRGLIPDDAVVFCTIHDYIAMVCAGQTVPMIEASDAASLGIYHVKDRIFDCAAMEQAGISTDMLPEQACAEPLGYYHDRIPVYPAIGDNQASFLGAVGENMHSMLVNVGTGSQFSVYSPDYLECSVLETRPFPTGGYILVGASLCGGYAYALLEGFFRQTADMLGVSTESCYPAMARMLESAEKPQNLPTILLLFSGTRQNPSLRASISGLDTDNLTPQHLVWAMLYGIAMELYGMYCSYRTIAGEALPLVGSGNGLRKNRALQKCFAEVFGTALSLCTNEEEAALGAARYAELLHQREKLG